MHRLRTVLGFLWLAAAASAAAQAPVPAVYPVGVREVEYVETTYGPRTLTMNVFYPGALPEPAPPPFAMELFANFRVYRDVEIATAPRKFPLVMLSHGRGGSGLVYAWLAEYLAARGYVVAAIDHYRANANDRSIVYLANKLWQRPVDVSLDITYLTTHEPWARAIDETRIGIAGHSQGGFTALWIGGARVNAERFAAFQQHWKSDLSVPAHIRDQMPVDATPALEVADPRVRAAFAMAPGVIQAFGMDAQSIAHMAIPAYIIVGAGDTVTPPGDNAVFAAEHIRNVDLAILRGPVGHEIFVNECSAEGKLELPETCVDAPGVDRAKLHADIGAAAVAFFDDRLGVARPWEAK
ncbi:MAG TPA: lipoprotein signal peptide [Casimicrobiaceae bacterium]|nr:lipoprotein signal peptide [Casimicrobiaceae bacterium]